MSMPSDFIAISSDGVSAQIDPLGAQLSVLRDAEGRDLLWDGDPAIWASRAPILFPIVGELNHGLYHIDGQTHALGRHGFARRRRFELVEHTAAKAVLRLSSDAETLAVYPFGFVLDLTFETIGASLSLTADITNPGEAPLPASFGFHPAFRWPLPYGGERGAHRVRFARVEDAPIRRINSQGLVLPDTLPSPVEGRDLALRDALFVNDALVFDQLNSGSLSYGVEGGAQLEIDFGGAPFLGLWTKPGAPFICVEPWHGIADPEGFEGDFREKPGVFEVAPGETRRIGMSIRLG
jgi:galactose mutarotase-like enzyme